MGGHGVSRRGLLLGGLTIAGGGMIVGATEAWALDGPPIIDCAQWGARPSREAVPVWNQRPVKILVHHTASPNVDDFSRGAADTLARNIQNFHMDRRGWLDTGQHFTISRGGFVLEGRHRSLEVLRVGKRQVEGAHCTGQNVLAVGIENEGTYMGAEPTGALWDRLRLMCAFICQQYGIAPTELYGHRDFKDTLCPGDVLYGRLDRLRSEVAVTLGKRLEGGASRRASWPLLRLGDRGNAVLTAQRLLRASGTADVRADGQFERGTDHAIRGFQEEHRTEEVNGLVGGETWPLLVRLGHERDEAEAAKAMAALGPGQRAAMSERDWQRALTAAAKPR